MQEITNLLINKNKFRFKYIDYIKYNLECDLFKDIEVNLLFITFIKKRLSKVKNMRISR